MLKCKFEHCQYPNCDGENCGISTEELLTYMCAELAHQREIPRQMYWAALGSTVGRIDYELKRFLPVDYKPTCPYGACDCISDPAYIRKYRPEWWIELGRPTACSCDQELFDARKECPYYDDEDK
jgi:hypothetical protein